VAVPQALRGRPVIVRASIERTDETHPLPPAVLGPPPLLPESISLSALGVSTPPADGVVRVTARELPLPPVVTNAVEVAPGPWLSVAIALDPICRGADVDGVDFVVTAIVNSQTHEVFRETLAANDPAATTWHERRIALDAVVAPATRFQLSTRVVLRAG